MSAPGKRLIDHDELERFRPRGLSGGASQPGPRWRPTRIEAEDKSAMTVAIVEEVRGQGWRYVVTCASRVVGSGNRLSKERAIAAATRAMERRGATS
jgi:hypothetical protein